MHRGLLPTLCLMLALLTCSWAPLPELEGEAHPMDGPDVELRIQRTKAGLRLALRANLVFLDETLGSMREIPQEIAPEEEQALEETTLEWLRDSQILRTEAGALEFKKLNATWVPADPERIPYFPREGERALTYLDLRLDYSVPESLDQVTVTWPTFPVNPVLAAPGSTDMESTPTIEVKAVLMAGPEERVATLTKEEASYLWRLPQGQGADHLLALPAVPNISPPISPHYWIIMALGAVLSACMLLRRSPLRLTLALIAIAVMFSLGRQSMQGDTPDWGTEQATKTFHVLHGNLYRAFDFHEPESVYDALEQTVHGDLLEELYREIHTSLIMEEEEGALCRVETVSIKELVISETSTDAPLQFKALCTWQVLGVVHHWGHSHQRKLQWTAEFRIAARPEGWRMVEARILETERLPVEVEEEPAPSNTGKTF
ncbi:MAG: hypothetical protein GY930_20025 [bacterium]|nr:hypothetical protein [bacterium]